MKRCPECRRDYYDDTLLYCLDDGAALLEGPSADSVLVKEPATAILMGTDNVNKFETRRQDQTVDQTAILPNLSDQPAVATGSRKSLAIAGLLGIILLTALGVGSYWFYGRGGPKQIESIAVMPFVNDSGNPDLEYLSDGMTETLISSLTQLPNLNVKARSSVFRYKGKEHDVKTLGRELSVQAILNGRVAQRGDQLMLSLELVDVATENAIWSHQYTRKQTDIVSLQSEIAKDISTKLKARLTGAEETKVTKSATADPEAYQAYLKGRFYWNQRGQGPGKMTAAIEQFKSATAKDPNYALAYAGLADCYALMPQETGAPPSEVLPQAKAFANRALEIDDSLAEAHATLGLINESLWQWSDAQKEFERSIALNPNYPTAHQWYSGFLGVMNRPDDRLAEIKKAYDLDPLSPPISLNVGLAHFERGELSLAVGQFNKTLEISPNFFVVHIALAIAYLKDRRADEALMEAQKAVELSKRHGYALATLSQVLAASGNRKEALRLVREIEQNPLKGESDEYFISAMYAGMGEKDQAFVELEKSYQKHNTFLTNLRIDALMEPLRNDPRYKDMIRRMGLPE